MLGRQNEDVAEQPDAQDAEHQRDSRLPQPDECPLYCHAESEADDRIRVDVQRPIRDLQDIGLPSEEHRQARGKRHHHRDHRYRGNRAHQAGVDA